jgi:hypothetical protein
VTDEEERELRIELMTAQIEQARMNIDKMRLEMKMENRKFLLALAAALGAGVAIGRFWLFHQ